MSSLFQKPFFEDCFKLRAPNLKVVRSVPGNCVSGLIWLRHVRSAAIRVLYVDWRVGMFRNENVTALGQHLVVATCLIFLSDHNPPIEALSSYLNLQIASQQPKREFHGRRVLDDVTVPYYLTDCHGRVGSIPASYSGSPGFKFRHGYLLSWLRVSQSFYLAQKSKVGCTLTLKSTNCWQFDRHLWADCQKNVGASTSHNLMGLHGLVQG
jgi:hypothetical protein